MKNPNFWKFMMAGSVFGWLFAIFGLLFPFEGTIRIIWWFVMLGWGIGHPLELAQSLPIGKLRGISLKDTIVNTMLFGFTWWLPLKMGVTEK